MRIVLWMFSSQFPPCKEGRYTQHLRSWKIFWSSLVFALFSVQTNPEKLSNKKKSYRNCMGKNIVLPSDAHVWESNGYWQSLACALLSTETYSSETAHRKDHAKSFQNCNLGVQLTIALSLIKPLKLNQRAHAKLYDLTDWSNDFCLSQLINVFCRPLRYQRTLTNGYHVEMVWKLFYTERFPYIDLRIVALWHLLTDSSFVPWS